MDRNGAVWLGRNVMPTLGERVVDLLHRRPGLSDREITNLLLSPDAGQQPVNQACRMLAGQGALIRQKREDGRIGNYLAEASPRTLPQEPTSEPVLNPDPLTEDSIKTVLRDRLREQGRHVATAWGKSSNIDIEARRENVRWVIEVKGRGSRPEMRVNFFLGVLGEILQRKTDPGAKYSAALPDLEQCRRLWARLPDLAKSRTGRSALFIDDRGNITEQA
jgi:hypothetical protein